MTNTAKIVIALLGVVILVMIGVQFGPRTEIQKVNSPSVSARPGEEDVAYLKSKKELLQQKYVDARTARIQTETQRTEITLAFMKAVKEGRAPGRDAIWNAAEHGETYEERIGRLQMEEQDAKRDFESFELEMRARNNGQLPAWWGEK